MAKLRIKPVKRPDKIINYWKKEPFIVLFILIFGLSFNILTVFWPVYQGRLLDSITDNKAFSEILRLALIFLTIIFLIQALRMAKRFYIRRFANITTASMRMQIYNNIIYKSATEIMKENIGNLMTRAISDVDICVEGMRKFTTELFDTGVLMASYLVAMLIYDIKITLLGILFVPLAMFLAEKLKKIIYKHSIAYRKKSGEIADITYDIVDNLMLYRINGRERANSVNYDNQLNDFKDKAVKAHILENSMQPVYNVIAMLGIVIVIYLGGVKTINGGWTIGEFSAYIIMFTALAIKASKAAKLFNSVQKSQVSWQRIKPYFVVCQTKNAKNADVRIAAGRTSLEVSSLSFSYESGKESVIKNISFKAKDGEIIGVTGAIASGKSALAAAITGLYEYSGSIKIDGKELRDYSNYERSLMISYLSHRPQLMSDTIYNNITLGKNADIGGVLRDVNFDEDLRAIPKGAQTLVGNNGLRLSGGQQARIALARALFNKNKIIILDDPFSAVDMKTEEEIIQNLRANYKNSLIILVSHRLAIFDKIDNVLLLNSDKTYLFGTHNELLKCSEVYSTIYSLQNALAEADNE